MKGTVIGIVGRVKLLFVKPDRSVGPLSYLAVAVLAVILVSSLLMRFRLARTMEIEKDEVNFFVASQGSEYSDFLLGKYNFIDHPPLFFLINKSINLFAEDIYPSRMFNLFLFGISLVVLFTISSYFSKSPILRTALPVWFSVSPYFLNLTLFSTPYSLAWLLMLVSMLFSIKLLDNRKAKTPAIIGFVTGMVLFIYTSYFSLFFIASLVSLLVILYKKKRLRYRGLESALIFSSIAGIPQFIVLLANVKKFADFSQPAYYDKLTIVTNVFSNSLPLSIIPPFILTLATVSLLVLMYFTLFRHPAVKKNPGLVLFVAILMPLNFSVVFVLHFTFGFHLTDRAFFIFATTLLISLWYLSSSINRVWPKILLFVLIIMFFRDFHAYTSDWITRERIQRHKRVFLTMSAKCDPDTMYVLNSRHYDYFSIMYYYINGFGLKEVEYDRRKAECVFNRTIVFENGELNSIFAKEIKVGGEGRVYFLDLINGAGGLERMKDFGFCRLKPDKCIFIHAGFVGYWK